MCVQPCRKDVSSNWPDTIAPATPSARCTRLTRIPQSATCGLSDDRSHAALREDSRAASRAASILSLLFHSKLSYVREHCADLVVAELVPPCRPLSFTAPDHFYQLRIVLILNRRGCQVRCLDFLSHF